MAALIQSAETGLVGREHETGELERRLDELRSGRAAVVVVSGEPGIGKTRLLAELQRAARARGYTALSGRALEFERDVPFAPLIDALDEHLARLDPGLLSLLDDDQLSELAAVFPALADRPGTAAPGLEAERYRLHRAVRELLHALALSRPLVLALDDLQWADEATLELLAHVLRRPPPGRVLIAVSYSPSEAAAPLIGALDAAARAGAPLHPIELSPLSEAHTEQLLAGSAIDPDHARAIFEHSGGNPFYIEQLAHATRSASELSHAEPPAAVAAAIAQEVATLRDSAQQLLLAGAVIGDPFDGALAVAAADLDPARVKPLLEHLCAHDLIRQGEDPRLFAFRHSIVRAAIYASAPSGTLAAMHERAAEELERRGASTWAIAHHLERGARPGDLGAAELLARAADEAIARAPATAARWYETALDLRWDDPASARRELLVSLARALCAAGRLDAAHERLVQALSLLPAGPDSAPARSELIALCADLDQLLGRHAEAQSRLLAGLESLPPDPSPARLALETELALQPAYARRSSPQSDSAAEALAEAQPDDRAAAASIRAGLALRATLLGKIHDATGHAVDAADLLDALDEQELAARLDVPHRLGAAELYLNRYRHAVRHLARGVALARATGQGRFLTPMLSHLAASQAMLGQLDSARRSAQDALDGARLTGPPSLVLWTLIHAGLTEIQAGDFHAADVLAREAHELTGELPPSSFTAEAHALLATTSLELGDAARARALFERGEVADRRQPDSALRSMYWEPLVRTLLAVDGPGEAERVLHRIDEAIASPGLPIPRAHARRARARLLLATGHPSRAAEHALGAATLAQQAGASIDAARARALAGEALAAAGHDGAAVSTLERAHRMLTSQHADGHRDRAARDLRLLGQDVPRPTQQTNHQALPQLTPRQQQIARLVADGLTNQQIADELHLSVKTVEMHLTRAYNRLGINRRTALARLMADAAGHAR